MADRDLYRMLGVSRSASADEIKKAYRKLARDLHPDRNPGNVQAEERFKEVSYANDILSDADKRALYDEFGEVGVKEGFNAAAARQARAWQSGGMPGGAYGRNFEDIFKQGAAPTSEGFSFNFEDIFGGGGGVEDLFGRGKRARKRPRKGADQESEVRIGFVDSLRGTEREFTFRRPGSSDQDKAVRVRIPAGVRSGGKVRLRGQGQPGADGGAAGDLVLTVHVDEHPFLRREEDDLHMSVPVTLTEAWRGAKIKIPTLDGEVSLTIPAKTQGGSVLRLKGKGVKRRDGTTGDLYVHLELRFPTGESQAADEAMAKLADAYTSDVRESLKL